MTPNDPEFATFRDLVKAVQGVDDKLDAHRLDIERRLGRIEKALVLVGLVALVPALHLHSVPLLDGAVSLINHL